MRLEEVGIGCRVRIIERVIEVDLHSDCEARIVIFAPHSCFHMQCEECKPLLLVGEAR